MAGKRQEMFSGRPPGSSEPILDCSFTGNRPSHDRLDRLMGVAQFAAQRCRDRFCVSYLATAPAVSRWKSLALFRQHVSAFPDLNWADPETVRTRSAPKR